MLYACRYACKYVIHVLKTHVQSLDVCITLIVLDALSPMESLRIPAYTPIFLETIFIGLHYAADIKGLSSFTFFWRAS